MLAACPALAALALQLALGVVAGLAQRLLVAAWATVVGAALLKRDPVIALGGKGGAPLAQALLAQRLAGEQVSPHALQLAARGALGGTCWLRPGGLGMLGTAA